MRLLYIALACLILNSSSAQTLFENGNIDWDNYNNVMLISQSRKLNHSKAELESLFEINGFNVINEPYNCNAWVTLLTNNQGDMNGRNLFNEFVYSSTSTVYIDISNQSLDEKIDGDQIVFRFYDCTSKTGDILYHPFYIITLKSSNGFFNQNIMDISIVKNLITKNVSSRNFSKLKSIERCKKEFSSLCHWDSGFEVIDVYNAWGWTFEDLLSTYNSSTDKEKYLDASSKIQNREYDNNNIRIRTSNEASSISKVAVIGKASTLCDGSTDDGQGLAEVVEGELLGIYGVVERKHLEEILDEQKLALSGLLFEDSDLAQAGCLAGAQGTVLVSYGCLQGKTKLQVKLVDCSTSDLYWSATGFDVSEFDLLGALRMELGK